MKVTPSDSVANVLVIDGILSLQSLDLPDSSELSLTYRSDSARLQLHVECPSATACGDGRLLGVRRGLAGKKSALQLRRDLDGSVPVILRFAGKSVDLSLNLVGKLPIPLLSDADISHVSFLDLRGTPSQADGASLAWSGVRGGTVQIPEINGSATLAVGEWVEISGSRLRVARVVATDSALDSYIRGDADRLALASGNRVRDLQPTWFEWIVARYSRHLQIGWGIVVLLSALMVRASSAKWGRL